jgi:hypothetical protein
MLCGCPSSEVARNLQGSCKSHTRVIHTLGIQQVLRYLHHIEDYIGTLKQEHSVKGKDSVSD